MDSANGNARRKRSECIHTPRNIKMPLIMEKTKKTSRLSVSNNLGSQRNRRWPQSPNPPINGPLGCGSMRHRQSRIRLRPSGAPCAELCRTVRPILNSIICPRSTRKIQKLALDLSDNGHCRLAFRRINRVGASIQRRQTVHVRGRKRKGVSNRAGRRPWPCSRMKRRRRHIFVAVAERHGAWWCGKPFCRSSGSRGGAAPSLKTSTLHAAWCRGKRIALWSSPARGGTRTVVGSAVCVQNCCHLGVKGYFVPIRVHVLLYRNGALNLRRLLQMPDLVSESIDLSMATICRQQFHLGILQFALVGVATLEASSWGLGIPRSRRVSRRNELAKSRLDCLPKPSRNRRLWFSLGGRLGWRTSIAPRVRCILGSKVSCDDSIGMPRRAIPLSSIMRWKPCPRVGNSVPTLMHPRRLVWRRRVGSINRQERYRGSRRMERAAYDTVAHG